MRSMNSRIRRPSVPSSISLPSSPANRSPNVAASLSDRSMGASRDSSAAVILRALRTLPMGCARALAISLSVGSRPSSWAR